jgi:hypothetical protein
MAFAFGESSRCDGEGTLEFKALFDDEGESSRKANRPSFAGGTCGTTFDELTIVVSIGLAGRSRISDPPAFRGWFEGVGMCSMASRELTALGDIEIGGGFRFLLIAAPSDDPVDSKDGLLLLSCRCPFDRLDVGVLDLDPALDTSDRTSKYGVSPRCNFASTSLSVTCRLRGVPSPPFLLLPLLPARLLFTLSLPSITFAGGGG